MAEAQAIAADVAPLAGGITPEAFQSPQPAGSHLGGEAVAQALIPDAKRGSLDRIRAAARGLVSAALGLTLATVAACGQKKGGEDAAAAVAPNGRDVCTRALDPRSFLVFDSFRYGVFREALAGLGAAEVKGTGVELVDPAKAQDWTVVSFNAGVSGEAAPVGLAIRNMQTGQVQMVPLANGEYGLTTPDENGEYTVHLATPAADSQIVGYVYAGTLGMTPAMPVRTSAEQYHVGSTDPAQVGASHKGEFYDGNVRVACVITRDEAVPYTPDGRPQPGSMDGPYTYVGDPVGELAADAGPTDGDGLEGVGPDNQDGKGAPNENYLPG